jgi:mono/diheme cytochrome c family protein
MKTWWLPTVVAVLTCVRPGAAVPRDLGGEVRTVFAVRCAGCHGADLAKPKGRFGYVLDLRRLGANPEMVIPSRPAESELWSLVARDEMPPSDSPQGPLTPAQKETIRAWIEAGAPEPVGAVEAPSPEQRDAAAATPLTTVVRLAHWLGRFHVLLIHFPIALIFAAGVGETWSAWRRRRAPSDAVRFCLWLGAVAAVPTAGLGWLFAAGGNGASSPQLLLAHRWLGTTAAAVLLLTAIDAERDTRRGRRSGHTRLLLAGGIVVTALTAHVGGLLARGPDFLDY